MPYCRNLMTTAALLGACVLNYSFGQVLPGTYPHMDNGPDALLLTLPEDAEVASETEGVYCDTIHRLPEKNEPVSRMQEDTAFGDEVTAWVEADENESEAPEWFVEGRKSYDMSCLDCHQSGGVADSMADSRWAGESHEALARILLQGMEGQRGLMTSYSWMDDDELAAVISYIRVRWHDSGPVSPDTIRRIREETEDRTEFWTEEELRAFVEAL